MLVCLMTSRGYGNSLIVSLSQMDLHLGNACYDTTRRIHMIFDLDLVEYKDLYT